MKKLSIVILVALCLILGGCSAIKDTEGSPIYSDISKEIYYTTEGHDVALSGKYMLFRKKGLVILDLNTKEIIKEIVPPYSYIGGYAIDGTKVVYSTCSNVEDADKDTFYDETANTEIYLYDINDGSTTQITTNPAGQISPDIWGDYIVWMDNRNDTVQDNNPEWDIYLYQISTNQVTLISTASGIHTNPQIADNKIVWEDGRNFQGENFLRWGGNVPENNTDIYMYDIETGVETAIASGPLQECNPYICGNYIVWEDRNECKKERELAAEIYLYNISTKEETRITDDKVDQRNPKLYGNSLVWMDERNGNSTNDVYENGKAPNSDIFLYDIVRKKEYLLTGKEPQVSPAISEQYIAYITSRQINPEINVIKY